VIVDTSAILDLAFAESRAGEIFDALCRPEIKRISAANLFEAFAVVDRRNDPEAVTFVEEVIERFGIVVEAVTSTQVSLARSTWNQFGRGSGHPAGLNFGDCFAHPLAMERAEPLLSTGNDFALTDVLPVI
jgi:ribonuclease VapC